MKQYSILPKILLVEDNEVNQLVTSKFLRQLGAVVCWAHHGKEAVEMIVSKDFQMILMDLQMPIMDGFESTQIIRSMSDQYFRTVPIIAFSASGLIEVCDKAKQYGMNDFIGKPVTLRSLENLVSKYIAHTNIRPLYIDFDLHTDGDDDFKNELIDLLIDNITELQKSISSLCEQSELSAFKTTLHKVKPALSILNDNELSCFLEDIQVRLKDTSSRIRKEDTLHLNTLCDDVKQSLKGLSLYSGS